MPNTLLLDIETSPIEAFVWKIHDENIGINQIKTDWRILSWSAKWLGESASKVMYAEARTPEQERAMLNKVWLLLHTADAVIYHNGKRFDTPKLNSRFLVHGLKPPSPYRKIDTYPLAKQILGETSNKLEFLTQKYCKKYKKLTHKRFPGFELWRECLAGNPAAWVEMKRYNVHDVLSLEEFYGILRAWDSSVSAAWGRKCDCGAAVFKKEGFSYTAAGKFQRYSCLDCGKWAASRENLLTKPERAHLWRSAGGH